MQKLNLKKFFLYLLIGSVAISAILGIIVILFGNFGELESRILATTLTITCTSILGLACGVSFEVKETKTLPILGICVAVISAFLWLVLIWFEIESSNFWRSIATATLLAVSLSHLSLVSLAKLDKRFKWAMVGVFVSSIGLLLITIALIWQAKWLEAEFVARLFGVLSIVVAALTVIIPVFHKLSDNVDQVTQIDMEISKLQARIEELEQRKQVLNK